MDPFTQYAMVVAGEALKDSGLNLEKINKDRVGVIWGSGIGGLLTFQEEVKSYTRETEHRASTRSLFLK